jgi:ATP-dependent RNA helicase DeaD
LTTTFADLGVNARLLTALAKNSIDSPVTVQVEAIPPLLRGRDVVIQAPTGSGKTLAFILPIVERLIAVKGPGPRALVVTPTRELAIQVDRVFQSLATGLKSALVYGGVGYATQERDLKAGVDLVVGTPGRILDMVSRRRLSLNRVQFLVLDEGDEMLDAGFAPDVERIIELTYQPQMALASATMPDWVSRMIERHLDDPVRIVVAAPAEDALEHGLLRVTRPEKLRTLSKLLQRHRGSVIVFGRTKHGVRKLSRDLRNLGHDSAYLQGNLSQNVRDRTMDAFRGLRTNVLVATNVAARGLDISHVDLVINYDLPDSPQWLTHRVGRTARMGVKGRALTFVTPEDEAAWRTLRRQGAPALPELDARSLLAEGDWRYVAASLVEPEPRVRTARITPGPSGAARPAQSWNRRRRRPRGRGPYRSDQRPASAGA